MILILDLPLLSKICVEEKPAQALILVLHFMLSPAKKCSTEHVAQTTAVEVSRDTSFCHIKATALFKEHKIPLPFFLLPHHSLTDVQPLQPADICK